MAFNQATFSPVGAISTAAPAMYSYSTDDQLSSVLAAGYFNDKIFQLESGDSIYCSCSDANAMLTYGGANDDQEAITSRAPLNQRVINKEEDWPQDETNIIHEPNTEYKIGAYHTTLKQTIPALGSSVVGLGPFSMVFEYLGTGAMFESSEVVSLLVSNVRVGAPNGSIFNMSGGGIVFLTGSNIIGWVDVGLLNNVSIVANLCSFAGGTGTGMVIAGSPVNVSFDRVVIRSSSASYVGVDFGASTPGVIEFSSYEAEAAGGFGISGLSGSGNVGAGLVATVVESGFKGGIVPLENITEQDVRWQFKDNSANVGDTTNIANIYMSGPMEVIPIAGGDQNVFNEVGIPTTATWNLKTAARFKMNTDGSAEYIGERNILVDVTVTAAVAKAGGGSDNLEMQIGKNWVYAAGNASNVGEPDSVAATAASGPQQVVSTSTFEVATGDKIKPIFRNQDGTSNIELCVNSMVIFKV